MSCRLHWTAVAAGVCSVVLSTPLNGAQAPQPAVPSAAAPAAPTFDVVSIRRSPEGTRLTFRRLPTGGLIMTGMPLTQVMIAAYRQGMAMKGIPAWTRDERYDISTTASPAGIRGPDRERLMIRAAAPPTVHLIPLAVHHASPAPSGRVGASRAISL